jgi:hypothetical protein
MNMVRINDTPYFAWMIDEQQTLKLLQFLKELKAIKLDYTEAEGLKTRVMLLLRWG